MSALIRHPSPGDCGFGDEFLNATTLEEQARAVAKQLDEMPRDAQGQVDSAAFSISGWDHVFVAAVIRALLEARK